MRASIRRRSIAFKVLAYVTSILAAAVLAATIATGYFTLEFARARLEERIADYAKYTAERLDSNFRSWATVTVLHARAIDGLGGRPPLDEAARLARLHVSQSDDIVGGGSWWNYYLHDAATKYAVRYYGNDKGSLTDHSGDYATGVDDFPNDAWFQIVKDGRSPADYRWTEPYHDPTVDIDMVTCSAPFFDGDRKWIGLVTSDISLASLQRIVSEVRIGETGYAFLVSAAGAFISHPERGMSDSLAAIEEGRYSALAEALGSGGSGIARITGPEGVAHFAYAPVANPGWGLAISVPEEVLYAARNGAILRSAIVLLAVIGLAILVLMLAIRRWITRPLGAVSDSLAHIAAEGEADLTVALEVVGNDEIAALSAHFNDFQGKLASLVVSIHGSLDELHGVGEDLSADATETAASLNQIAASIAGVKSQVSRQSAGAGESLESAAGVARMVDVLSQRIEAQHRAIESSDQTVSAMLADI
ncbi:MAG TPA: methyl-accepting chemotaxis protein, partial [Spirochaetia bacterium]|nr:methyl-accepting chemotaxis protein [Spirochaetia bacterium]